MLDLQCKTGSRSSIQEDLWLDEHVYCQAVNLNLEMNVVMFIPSLTFAIVKILLLMIVLKNADSIVDIYQSIILKSYYN